MWKRLRHRNIVALIGVTQDPMQFVSEWMPNGILTEYLEENPDADRLRLLLDVAEGLAFLHTNHTIHGDLKGPNILIDRGGHARLTDFGFASVVRGLNSVHITKVQGYTTQWAAPEVLRDGDKITREADVFAFGMVVIEVFTGMPPFHELPDSVTLVKIVNGERPGRPRIPGLTDSVWNMTCSCWLQEPTGRPTMTQVIEILCGCRGPCTLDLSSSSLAPRVLAEGTNNKRKVVSVAHIPPAMDSARPHELITRLFAPNDLTDASNTSHYGAGYRRWREQGMGYHQYPQDPLPVPHPPSQTQAAEGWLRRTFRQIHNLVRRQVVVPPRPHVPDHRQNYFDQSNTEGPITFPQHTGVEGVALIDAMNENFDNLIGRDDAMFASYAGPAIALRLEVGLASAHYRY